MNTFLNYYLEKATYIDGVFIYLRRSVGMRLHEKITARGRHEQYQARYLPHYFPGQAKRATRETRNTVRKQFESINS